MFVAHLNTSQMEITRMSPKKPSYSIKKLLKQIVKYVKHQKFPSQPIAMECEKKAEINEGFESLDETCTTDIDYDSESLASFSIDWNEKSCSTKAPPCNIEDFDLCDISDIIPIHYVSTENGSFFWSTTNDIPVDNDLAEPLCCSTNNQLAGMQDRWTHV